MDFLDGIEGWRAYTEHQVPAVVRRDVIDVEGSDTLKFLHAILSQDVMNMVDGETRWSFLLQPQGKLVAHFRVHRVSPDRVVLDTEAEMGEMLHAAMRRYLIRTKCTLTLAEALPVLRFYDSTRLSDIGRAVPGHPLLGGFDVFGAELPDLGVDSAIAEIHRVLRGVPAHGSELDESTIPNSTGLLGPAVSFTKGCYVGQELVERIDSRGGAAPTRLVRFDVEPLTSDALVPPQLPIRLGDQGKALGTVTSLATDPVTQRSYGLGYVARSVERGERLGVMPTTQEGASKLTFRVLDDVESGGR